MCFEQPKTQKIEAPPPPPPPPADAPKTPALNEQTVESKNASQSVAGKRRGRSSLRIDLNPPSTGTGLAIRN